jgi:hypothetical protein
MEIMKKILRNTPIVNLVYNSGERTGSFLKTSVYLSTNIAALITLPLYITRGINTSEWNPLTQQKESIETFRISKQREKIEEKLYDNAWKTLFSVNGLANKDKNRIISYDEQFDAWNKMNLIDKDKIYFESNKYKTFPEPSRKDLERAIERYLSEA